MSLLAMLRAIGRKPGFYVGNPMDNRFSIWQLQAFVVGYQSATHLAPVEGDDILDAFTFWLCLRFDCLDTANWAGLLHRHCGDEEAAFRLFFELFEEYVQDRERLGEPELKARFILSLDRLR